MKPIIKGVIIGAIAAAGIILSGFIITNDETAKTTQTPITNDKPTIQMPIKNDEVTHQIPIAPITSIFYNYNTVCDLGDFETFMIEKVFVTLFEIQNGKYNDNEKLIKFFKTNEFLSKNNITPDQVFKVKPEASIGLVSGPDPFFSDMSVMAPVIFDILGASPELINWISVQDGEDQATYNNRLLTDVNKCK